MKDFLKNLAPDVNLVDFDFDQIFSKLEANSIKDIRQKLKNILKTVFDMIRQYAKYAEKIFYLSIILIIWDAFYYMHQYYCDDAFDNMFVDGNLRHVWETGDKENILPLRNWELKIKYQYSSSVKLSKKEANRVFIQSVPTLLFIAICGAILAIDAALTMMLKVFRKNAGFGIAYDGMETGVKLSSLLPGLESGTINPLSINLRGFNLTTEPCLPQPETTNYGQIGIIGGLMALCIFSCILDIYGARLRAKICNVVFKERAIQRAEYLYKRIKTGRTARRIQLNMLICQQLDIKKRKSEYWGCFMKHQQPKKTKRIFNCQTDLDKCPLCRSSYSVEERKPYTVTHNGEKKQVMLCSSCNNEAI
jgi:hypothetical protein